MEPYLAPLEDSEVSKRLPGPVEYEIEQLPHKISLDISTSKEST